MPPIANLRSRAIEYTRMIIAGFGWPENPAKVEQSDKCLRVCVAGRKRVALFGPASQEPLIRRHESCTGLLEPALLTLPGWLGLPNGRRFTANRCRQQKESLRAHIR